MKANATSNTRLSVLKTLLITLIVSALGFSCSQDEFENNGDPEDNALTEAEVQEDYFNDDTEEITLSAISTDDFSGGKAANTDERLQCAVVTRTGDENSGTIVIDFGTGCTGERGNVRRGKIIISYIGRWNVAGSYWTVTGENYFINNIAVEGLRMVRNISTSEDVLAFEVTMENGRLTFPDGAVATRIVHKKRELERDSNGILKRLIIYGTAEGNNRNGRGYQVEILERLVYDRACEDVFIPVSGKKLIKHGQREITIDYGNGECDNVVVITNKNGRSWRFNVGK
ncbi:MAG TPA: hypothetical protein VGD65_25985 [Chryseosolibacter sp.]